VRQRLNKPAALHIVLPPESVLGAPRKIGPLTFASPDFQRGEVVKVSIPVGDLAMQLSRKVTTARRERADQKAAERVQRDLDQFLAMRRIVDVSCATVLSSSLPFQPIRESPVHDDNQGQTWFHPTTPEAKVRAKIGPHSCAVRLVAQYSDGRRTDRRESATA
jgi:hypothetical protein